MNHEDGVSQLNWASWSEPVWSKPYMKWGLQLKWAIWSEVIYTAEVSQPQWIRWSESVEVSQHEVGQLIWASWNEPYEFSSWYGLLSGLFRFAEGLAEVQLEWFPRENLGYLNILRLVLIFRKSETSHNVASRGIMFSIFQFISKSLQKLEIYVK